MFGSRHACAALLRSVKAEAHTVRYSCAAAHLGTIVSNWRRGRKLGCGNQDHKEAKPNMI
eukprot:6200204-Pleurochrysis_carterae.AAC.3